MLNYNLEFKDLELFLALCNYSSFTKAADSLYITQSSLSRRIKALESELGVKLVKRGGTHFEITEAGQQFYKLCVEMLHGKDNLYTSMNRFRAGNEGGLRIAADPNYFSLKMIIEGISKMKKEYPHIRICYESIPNLDVRETLTEDSADVVFTFQSVAADYPQLAYTVIGENRLVVGVGHNHRLFNRESIGWTELNGENLTEAVQTSNMAFNKLMQRAQNQGCRFSKIHLVKNTAEALGYVATGEYLMIHGAVGVEIYEPMEEHLRFIPVCDEDNGFGWPVAAYRADKENPLIEKLLSVFAARS